MGTPRSRKAAHAGRVPSSPFTSLPGEPSHIGTNVCGLCVECMRVDAVPYDDYASLSLSKVVVLLLVLVCSLWPPHACEQPRGHARRQRQINMLHMLTAGTWRCTARALVAVEAESYQGIQVAFTGLAPTRSFSDRSAAIEQQEIIDASSSGHHLEAGHGAGKWDWHWVMGKSRGRKPAIKRPSRHQWWYCNPGYDAAEQLPTVMRSPFAPPGASASTDWPTYERHLRLQPANARDERRYRKQFNQHLKLRELDWREAFQRGLADDVRTRRKQERLTAEVQRQDAWRAYKEALFERARLAGAVEGTTAAKAAGNGADGAIAEGGGAKPVGWLR